MMRWPRIPAAFLPFLALTAACAGQGATAPGPPAPSEAGEARVVKVPPAAFGEPFPTWVYKDLNAASGSGGSVNLATLLGKKPVVFCYWIPGRSRSEQMLLELERIAGEAEAGRLAVLGVVRAKAGLTVPQIVERIAAIGLRVPVLNDEEFRLGQQLAVRTVPSLAVVDGEGRLRLASAGSLHQELEYKLDVEAAIRRVAEKGVLGTYGLLPRYDPVSEMIGKKAPEFEAPNVVDGAMRRSAELMDPKRLNALVFWSVDCPHCKKSIPELNDWLRQNPGAVNVISLATVMDDAAKLKTRDYSRLQQFVFPTLEDRGMRVGELFQVGSTPTVLVVRPDGIVDSVLTGDRDFGTSLMAKRKEILGI